MAVNTFNHRLPGLPSQTSASVSQGRLWLGSAPAARGQRHGGTHRRGRGAASLGPPALLRAGGRLLLVLAQAARGPHAGDALLLPQAGPMGSSSGTQTPPAQQPPALGSHFQARAAAQQGLDVLLCSQVPVLSLCHEHLPAQHQAQRLYELCSQQQRRFVLTGVR